MPTVNETLHNEAVAHAIGLQRYSNGIVRRMISLLNRVDADLFAQLTAKLDDAPETLSVERIEDLLTSVRALNSKAYAQLNGQLEADLKELVAHEVGYQSDLFKSLLPEAIKVQSVQPLQVYAAAMARPFQGKLLREYMQGLESGKAEAIRNAVRMGFVEGQTTSEIVNRIRGTKALNYADGLMETNRRGVEAIVRTAINHTGNYARQAFFKENEDLIKGWQFHATLDARTSSICMSLSGQVFDLGKGPQPPQHLNCRSIAVQILKSWRELGIPADEIPESTQSSMDGQVPASWNYNDWLSRQSAARQDDVLGKDRGALYRAGNLTVDRFVNDQGKFYTLDQLRVRDSAAFAKAGI